MLKHDTLNASRPCIARWLSTITHSPGSRRMRATIDGSLANVQRGNRRDAT